MVWGQPRTPWWWQQWRVYTNGTDLHEVQVTSRLSFDLCFLPFVSPLFPIICHSPQGVGAEVLKGIASELPIRQEKLWWSIKGCNRRPTPRICDFGFTFHSK